MAQGLQVWDEYGRVIVDTDSSMARVCGIVSGSIHAPSSGSVSIDPIYFNNNTAFAILTETAVLDTDLASALSKASININGNVISYNNLPCDMIYGVY